MDQYDCVRNLADKAAAILPGPPAEGDVAGYLQWREMVWGTALRLGRIAGVDADHSDDSMLDFDPDVRVTGAELLALAGVGRPRTTHRIPTRVVVTELSLRRTGRRAAFGQL